MTPEEAQAIAEVEGRPYCSATGRQPHDWGTEERHGHGVVTRMCLDCDAEVFSQPMTSTDLAGVLEGQGEGER